jgi:hypothetical protein
MSDNKVEADLCGVVDLRRVRSDHCGCRCGKERSGSRPSPPLGLVPTRVV